jgi:uncharacterized membrane protein YvbJ
MSYSSQGESDEDNREMISSNRPRIKKDKSGNNEMNQIAQAQDKQIKSYILGITIASMLIVLLILIIAELYW